MVLKETNLSGVQKGVLKYGWLFDQSVGGAFRGCNFRRGVHRGAHSEQENNRACNHGRKVAFTGIRTISFRYFLPSGESDVTL